MSVTGWVAVAIAGLVCLGIKLVGAYVPRERLEDPRIARIAALMTVALLAALVAVQAVTTGRSLAFDARLPALGVAAIALALRAPFIVVVLLAAIVAAGLRALGWML
ncbi:branched-chain amino acid transport [Beutenbergia cavernae DSM 12333]|uniref:Branched-chain amino acid transport n=1 Tax=Beutenbergia cavernae (strain ATCC BAA-8 / DSM 12333 / CCUG 43141 / JCM 11478 / NBRC 16432 / NCIMB 13614 / HKI 0122) TaxID=471853 RepID=C5BWQ2_BEUC1|nr:AzlD domain-containing protein [Beutenbergia cavernae]ACQ80718.1 branched-chain amino acid transport [Beutenbergia cavernae DSM 12333]